MRLLAAILFAVSISVNYSDAAIYIGDERIQAYEIGGRPAIHVESLPAFGFDILWDSREWTLRVSDRRMYSGVFAGASPYEGGFFTFWDGEAWVNRFYARAEIEPPAQSAGVAGALADSDIRFVLNGKDIPAHSADGRSFFLLEDMEANGYIIDHSNGRTSIRAQKFQIKQSDIGPINAVGIHTAHIHMNPSAHERIAFIPLVDGIPIHTARPYALMPSRGRLRQNAPVYVPLAATIEALGHFWSWDAVNHIFMIHGGPLSFEPSTNHELGDLAETPDLFEVWLSIEVESGDDESRLFAAYVHNEVVYVSLAQIASALNLAVSPDGNGLLSECSFGRYPGITILAPPKYGMIAPFSDELFRVALGGQLLVPHRAEARWVDGAWGLIDRQGQEVIAPRFDGIGLWGSWQHGFPHILSFLDGDLHGLLDQHGNIIAPAKFSWINEFSEGLAAVRYGPESERGGLWGFIDTEGNMVVPPMFEVALDFNGGLAMVQSSKQSSDQSGGLWGLVNTLGEVVVPPRYDQIWPWTLPVVDLTDRIAVRYGGLWGFIDPSGVEIVPPRFTWADAFAGGYARVNIGGYSAEWGGVAGGLWGVIDIYGNEIIPIRYCWISNITDGAARVNVGGRVQQRGPGDSDFSVDIIGGLWGLVDNAGNEILPPQFDHIRPIENGLAMVNKGGELDLWRRFSGGLWGLIDTEGNEITPIKYSGMSMFDDMILVNIGSEVNDWGDLSGGLWGMLDPSGREIVPLRYDMIRPLQDILSLDFVDTGGITGFNLAWGYAGQQLSAVNLGGLWGIADHMGNEIAPPIFADIQVTNENMIMVNFGGEVTQWDIVGGLWGLIDTAGNEVVPPMYDGLGAFTHGVFRDGLMIVRTGGKSGLINTHGVEILPPQFDEIRQLGHGMSKAFADGLWSLIDPSGNILTPPAFDEISHFTEGLAVIRTNFLRGIIDTSGNIVVPPGYGDIRLFDGGVAALSRDGLWGLIRIDVGF